MSKHEQAGGKKEQGFANSPFKGLKRALEDRSKPPVPPPGRKDAPPPPRAPRKPAAPGATAARQAEEERLFAQAMAGVAPMVDEHGVAPPPAPRPIPPIADDEAEALAHLADLVSGEGPFDIADSDEYIEGGAPGVDRRVLESLRRGEFAVQAHVDLHGLTRAEAKERVDKFLTEARLHGNRCVLIVHGRGLNSKDQIPVLKEQLSVWLRRGRIGREVLAFATARPHDGGAGAVYVLLRR